MSSHDPPTASGSAEAGFTLIEVIVVATLLAVVAAVLMTPMILTSKVQARQTNYAFAQQQARSAVESMVAQVRQASAINTPDSNTNMIDMNVYLGGTPLHVVYQCDVNQPGTNGQYRECIRVQAAIGATLPPLTAGTVVANNLTNGTAADPVFSLGPSGVAPYYMTATLKVPASGGVNGGQQHTIVLTDGALMRNMNIGN
jgi:prepilin-type N-terminal cleavage/methylation domain-containing protein